MELSSRLLPIPMILLIVGTSVACTKKEEDPPPPPVNNLVVALLTPVAGTQTNEVALSYSLVDADSELASIQVRFSTNGGVTFQAALATEFVGGGSSGTINLATGTFPGTPHAFVWDTLADLGQVWVAACQLRVTPFDTELGTAGTTASFTVDNRQKLPPAAIVDAVASPQTRDVVIAYTLFDDQFYPSTIVPEYSTNFGATWLPATEAVGPPSQGIVNLSTAPPPTGVPHTFVWDSIADVGPVNATCQFMITPSDASSVGAPGTSNDFDVMNVVNNPPTVTVDTPPAISIPTPTLYLPITYTLFDTESDRLLVTVQFSTNGGATFAPAVRGPGEGVVQLLSSPAGVSHTFTWNTLANVGVTIQGSCRIQIRPFDAAAGTAATNLSNFSIDNRDMIPPDVTMVSTAAENTINQRAVFDFSEAIDPASVIVGSAPPSTFGVFEDTDTTPGGTFVPFSGRVIFANQDRQVIFFPDVAFTENREIRIVMTSGITDAAGTNGLVTGSVSDPFSQQATFPLQVFEDRFLPGGIPDCARYLPDPTSDIWFYDFDTFGTFDADLGDRGLAGVDPAVNLLAREQVMAQVLFTLSDKYGRVPGTGAAQSGAWRVSFVCSQPAGTVRFDYSRMCVGRDEGGTLGRAIVDFNNNGKEDDCSATSPLGVFSGGIDGNDSSISAPLVASDLKYLDGTYSLGSGSAAEDSRFMNIQDAIWDWGHAVGTVSCHETGHSVGLLHDNSDSLNIMRSSASRSFLSNPNTRFGPTSTADLDSNLGLVP